MPFLHRKYNYNTEPPLAEKQLIQGYQLIEAHPLYGRLNGDVYMKMKHLAGKDSMATVDRKGNIYVNASLKADPEEWAYCIAHCLLHLAFGHFDKDNMPDDGENINVDLWAKACDIYVAQFLEDTDFGSPVVPDPRKDYPIKLTDEKKIYRHLMYKGDDGSNQEYGVNGSVLDMIGLEHPLEYGPKDSNPYMATFAYHLARAAKSAVNTVSSRKANLDKQTIPQEAAQWFLSHYPLLGGLAAGFRLIEDYALCQKKEIQIAAVNAEAGEIYINPTSGLTLEEWKFVLAHEYLHAGLDHAGRCKGRDRLLWNVACDFVVNGWLKEMNIGEMPDIGLLYDESLQGMSAEAVYDLLVSRAQRVRKHATFRGYGKGDIIHKGARSFGDGFDRAADLDDFFRNALRESLDYLNETQRGLIPAGLVEEIMALAAKPIPWDVELGTLFSEWFPPLQRHRSYSRASRRQGSTPEIPRPGWIVRDEDVLNRTFGVVLDTSGSMSPGKVGYALGAIASYAVSRDVGRVRVVFCDAAPYDIGYVVPEDIAGRVEVTGRGGTELQPAVDFLQRAKDFPSDAPVLLITDGFIEDRLQINRKHAYLLPKGNKLPYRPKGKVFYFG